MFLKTKSCADQKLQIPKYENVQIPKNGSLTIRARSKVLNVEVDWRVADTRVFVWYKDIYLNHYNAALIIQWGKRAYISVVDVVSPAEKNLDNFMNAELQEALKKEQD